MSKHIGEKIKQRRKELGWSLRQLTDKMGYSSHGTIARIEKGEVDVSQSKVAKFAKVLGVSVAYLMDWESSNNNNLSDVTVRMLVDSDFASLVEKIHQLDGIKLLEVKRYVNQITK